MLFEEINSNYIEHIITPIAPYFMCNHFVADEIHRGNKKYVRYELNINANDLLKNKNYEDINDGDIVQVQVDKFNFFCDVIMPVIEKKNIKIILITSQWHLPQIKRNDKTDQCLNNKHILLWASQNPIYPNSKKYMALPYGILHNKLDQYMTFVKSNQNAVKNNIIYNGYASAHSHLPRNHIRKKYDIFGKKSGKKTNYIEYLKNISNAKFAISTAGDRDDCYRHYECIGLNTIPISNIRYEDIFGDNMIYSDAEEMIDMIKTNHVNCAYKKPNKDILTIKYWTNILNFHTCP